MFIVAWVTRWRLDEDKDSFIDKSFYERHDTLKSAEAQYKKLVKTRDLHTVSLAVEVKSTDPI